MVGNNLGFTWVQPGDIWRPLGWDLGFIWFHMGFWIDVIDWIWLDHICGCGEPLFKTALTVPQWLVCLPCQTVCPPDQNACICLMILNFLVHHMLCFVKAELVESAQLGFQECRATLSTITLTTLIWRFASNFRSKTFAVDDFHLLWLEFAHGTCFVNLKHPHFCNASLRADELKRKNAELEREILEFKFSPLSTGSTEWRWPDGRDGRQTKHRGSTTSSDVGITNLRTTWNRSFWIQDSRIVNANQNGSRDGQTK